MSRLAIAVTQDKVAYFPFKIGAVECAAVSAGSGQFRAQAFFVGVPRSELHPVLARHGIQSEKIDTPFNCLLIRHQTTLMLIDTGAKAKPLVENLHQHGVAREDVGMVVLSHAHPDHVGGALDSKGKATFPNARYVISRVEHEQTRSHLTVLPLQLIEQESELLDGVHTLPAPGHTSGQIAVKIESQGETLLYTSDVLAHPIHLEHWNWNIVSDANRAEALRTRAALLTRAAQEGWWLFVYHFPFPGLCRIARDGSCWRITERYPVGSE
jgi:glyoxylase-like metal-dependent hydrolase (beta-lactamase superfamily II)